jgi:magnesium transporter
LPRWHSAHRWRTTAQIARNVFLTPRLSTRRTGAATQSGLGLPVARQLRTLPAMRVWSFIGGAWKQGDDRSADAWWFDIVGPHDGLSQLAERFRLHPLAVEDCYSTNIHIPKIDDFGDHLFIVIQVLTEEASRPVEELDAFVGEKFVITYADRTIAEVDGVHQALKKGVAVRPGTDGIFHAVFDRSTDSLLPRVSSYGDRLDTLQEAVVQEPGARSHTAILEMRAEAGRLRRILIPQGDVAMRLSRGEFPVIREPNRIYFRDIYDHVVRVDLALEAVREDAEVALSTHLSALNNRMNEVMKVLAVVSAIALPAVVITGIFGTNFDNVPGLHSNWGFTIMMASMLGIGGGLAWFFHRRGWW